MCAALECCDDVKLQLFSCDNQELLGHQDHLDMAALMEYQAQKENKEIMPLEDMGLKVNFLIYLY